MYVFNWEIVKLIILIIIWYLCKRKEIMGVGSVRMIFLMFILGFFLLYVFKSLNYFVCNKLKLVDIDEEWKFI